jgi:hypothetical protein
MDDLGLETNLSARHACLSSDHVVENNFSLAVLFLPSCAMFVFSCCRSIQVVENGGLASIIACYLFFSSS